MAVKVGGVEFYVGPKGVGAPDDLEAVIVDFIDGAKKRLEIAVQELESRPIAEAIIRARARKCLVKIVLEQDYLKSTKLQSDPWEASGKHEPNREIHNAILRSRIDVKTDYNTSIFHQKFIVRDRASLLTGSTNFTPTGTHSNLNHVVVIHDEKVAKIYAREFAEIQQGHFGKRNEGHDAAPLDRVVSNVPIRILFAPDHNPEMEIMKQMLKAKKRIDFAIFTFSKSSGIDDTMLRLLDMDMPISGAFDGAQGAQSWAAIKPLKKKGAKLSAVWKGKGVGKLHHKLMVLDEQVVIGGSFNYTGPANRLNDENIFILGDLETTSAAQRKAQKKIAGFALKEIKRIVANHGSPL
ncbi:phospholipase D-like domain-containing protein [Pelagibius sp. Alg239-R121]|uniref:phospholipase D-like domain-containing protein n=1 Tax=Pelagibius sp. Alg239-R121 TaxID=2993448 RepID=UPI0024A6BDBA|nr:phospholipase D-like domain-containing protein [Pelagibius sp. Alg239-R121]